MAATGNRPLKLNTYWPSRSAVLQYCAVWVSKGILAQDALRILDGKAVWEISTTLDVGSRVKGFPEQLTASGGLSFEGSKVTGMGFILEAGTAEAMLVDAPKNADILFPYLTGEDVNSRPDNSASRWIINFHDWSEERAARYRTAFEIIERLVKPERQRRKTDGNYVLRRPLPERYWQYADKRPAMVRAISIFDRVIVITKVSKVVMPVIVPTGQVFSHMLGVFATDDPAMLALLSSAPHYWWAISRASTMKGDLRYTPTDVFETLARPELTAELRELGERLDSYRRESVMLPRQAGLTATYNLVHDPGCKDADIAELRRTHVAIDRAVMRAYGWDDLALDHGFHETRQGVRYTVGPVVRQEILDRLLELNHERYAAEVAAGLHDKKQGRRVPRQAAAEQGSLFDA
jgi:hypothetical protein